MIRIFGYQLDEFLKDDKFKRIHKFERDWGSLPDDVIGFYMGEYVFLCPSPLIERKRGACDKCQYRFECYTDKWYERN